MKLRFVVPVLAVVGILLLLVGASWKRLHPPSSYWTQDDAQQYNEAFSEVHAAQDHAAHGTDDNHDESFAAARQRYEALTRRLDDARDSREQTGTYLAVAGLIVLLLAVLLRNYVG